MATNRFVSVSPYRVLGFAKITGNSSMFVLVLRRRGFKWDFFCTATRHDCGRERSVNFFPPGECHFAVTVAPLWF